MQINGKVVALQAEEDWVVGRKPVPITRVTIEMPDKGQLDLRLRGHEEKAYQLGRRVTVTVQPVR